MATRLLENSLWDIPDNKWNIKEDFLNESQQKTIVDGKNILAIVEGISFVPDGISRNQRFYPRKFWESILGGEELKRRMSDRLLLGCIGHSDRGVEESDIQDGKVSHIVTNLWIDENTNMGMGQFIILGTPAGRNLYTLMKAGCKIKTSSRASGDFKQDETYNDLPIVDENSYYLETFDFVINPGFLETNPLIKENVDKVKKDMEKKDMEFGKELLEHVKAEKDALNESLVKLREQKAVSEAKVTELNEKVAILESQIKELSEAKEAVAKVEAEKTEISEKLNVVSEELKAYKEIGEANDIKENLDKSATLLESYVSLGKPEAISEKLNEQKQIIHRYKECGSLEVLEETLPVVEHVLEEISKLGTLGEVKEIIERANQLTESLHKEKFEDLTIKISREYKTPVENVKKLLESVGEKETINILKSVAETNKKIVKEEVSIKEDKKPSINKESKNKPMVSEIFKRNDRTGSSKPSDAKSNDYYSNWPNV